MSRMEPLLRELDRLFSREVLGSIFVAGALSRIVSEATTLVTGSDPESQLLIWSGYLVVAITLFAWWERVEAATESASESADEKREGVAERFEETMEATKESVEETTDSVSETIEETREE